MKIFCLLVSLFTSVASAEMIQLNGKMHLWQTKSCANGPGLCGLPEELAPSWPVKIQFQKPEAQGKFRVTDLTFNSGEFQIHLTQMWAELPKPQVSYLMTQVELDKPGHGIVAVCSRYDATDAFGFLPPGACAGPDGDRIVGVSLEGSR